MKKIFSFFAALLFAGSMMAAEEVKATLDFTGTAWNIPTSGTNTEAAQFTDGTYTITLAAATNYKQNSGYLILGKQGSTLTLPAFTWKTTKIRVTGSSGASESVKQNIFVGETAVSTETTGAKNVTNEYAIAAAYQAAGNVYVLKVTSSHNTQITKIEVYGESGDTPAEPVVEYYLVGTMNNWTPATGYKLAANGANTGEYMLKTTFAANDQFKVRKVIDGEVDAWYPDGMDNNYTVTDAGKYNVYFRPDGQGGEGWHQGCIYAARIMPKTCAEVYDMAKNDEVLLNAVTVTYANGKNVYVMDATGAMLLYLPSADAAEWAAGDVLSGVEGTLDIYNGLYEVKPSDAQVAAVAATAGTAPEPIEFTAAPVADDMNTYVVLKNVSVSAASFPDNKNMDVTIGDQTIVLRNNFNANIAFDTEKTYDITGVVAVYNDNVQVYFISAEEVVDPRMAGAYNIGGANADYATLFAACQDVNAKGIKADVELLICANLTEPINPVLSNPTNFSITIRPNADEDRKIEFTATKDNFGPSGAFCIGGVRELKSGVDTIAWGTALTNNIIIDGYAEGGETRRLTFDTPQGFGSSAGPILFYGDVHNCKLINCIINNSRNGGTTGVTVRTANMAKFAANTPDYRPENILIENNIIAPRVNGQGVVINGSGAGTPGDGAPIGTIIRNNQITASNRGVFFNGVNGLVFEGNELTMNGAAGFNAHGLFGYTQVIGDIIVKNNVFKVTTSQVAAGDFGVIAIGSSGAITGREDDVHWIIDNNYFYGMDALAVATGKFKLMYVRAGSNTTLRHNTFYIPAFSNAVPMDLVAANCAAALYLAGSGAYAAENNIFVCNETASNVSLIRGALNDNIKNNVYHHAGGNAAILAGTVVAADSTAFFAEGANAGSKWKLPVFADAANGDLAITTADADLLMPRLAAVLVDITGADRRENTYAGAFEGPEVSPATAIDAVEVQGIQKIFRNGQVLIIKDGKTYNMMGQIVE